MDAAQQTALEAVAGRPLNADDIAACDPLLGRDSRNDVALAAYLSQGRKPIIQSRTIGIGTVLSVLAPDGGAFLDAIEALAAVDPNIKWGLKLLERGELDIGMAATRGLLDGIAANVISLAPSITVLLALAETEATIDVDKLSYALNIAEGRMML